MESRRGLALEGSGEATGEDAASVVVCIPQHTGHAKTLVDMG